MRTSRVLAALALAGAAALSTAVTARQWGQPLRPKAPPSPSQGEPVPDETVRMIELPLELPAVGNLDAVKQWHFGRIQGADLTDSPDVVLHIRIEGGRVVDIVAPRAPLSQLARRSDWVATETKSVVGGADYVERMIAFDADANDRLIAMMSLEPLNRDRQRLLRALR